MFGFDTAVIDWDVYLRDVHCPSVTEPMRKFDELRAAGRTAAARPAQPVARPGKPEVRARSSTWTARCCPATSIETYLWLRLPELHGAGRPRELGRLAAQCPALVQAERRDRGGFLRAVYRRYDGADRDELDPLVDEVLDRPRAASGSRAPPCAGCASTARPVTAPCCSPARSGR